MSSAAIALYVASRRVFVVFVCSVIDSVRKILDTPSYTKPKLGHITIVSKELHTF
jgi:hypothetical protein